MAFWMAFWPTARQLDALGQEIVARPAFWARFAGIVSRQVLPFHFRAVPRTTDPAWLASVPTAMQSCARGQETPYSPQKNRTQLSPDMFIRCQARPFHSSATLDTVVPGTPTQNEAVAHDRADRSAPPGGAFTTRQVLPFQASASWPPTAMQKETLVHETASSRPAASALRRTRQLAPFHASASTKPLPARLTKSPTAMQNEPLTHETPSSWSRVAGPVVLNAGAAARSAAEADLTTRDGPAAAAAAAPAKTTPARVAAATMPRSVARSPRIWHHIHSARPRQPSSPARSYARASHHGSPARAGAHAPEHPGVLEAGRPGGGLQTRAPCGRCGRCEAQPTRSASETMIPSGPRT